MKKEELVKKVQESLHLKSAKEAYGVVDSVFDVIFEAIKAGEEVRLGDIGKLVLTDRAARTCRNPKTGEQMEVPACKAVKFKAADKLKKAVNE